MEKIYQRVNGNLEPVALGGASPAEIAQLEEKVDAAQAKADGALPLTGGELTGMINYKTSFDYSNPPESNRLFRHLYKDVDDKDIGYCGVVQYVNNENVMSMFTVGSIFNEENVSPLGSELATCVQADGVRYATAPNPRSDNYGTDIVTQKTLKDYAPILQDNIVYLYLDAAGGSDTSGLFQGRGLSPEMPFKTLAAAAGWAGRYCGRFPVAIRLLSDISVDQFIFYHPAIRDIELESADTDSKKIITINNNGWLACFAGGLVLRNVKLKGNQARAFLYANGQSHAACIMVSSGVEMNGSILTDTDQRGVCYATYGGRICITSSISGTVTGRRYQAAHGGVIATGNRGANAIPGSVDGVTDSISHYL